jgi:ABC-type bacteriocin/lantibiotic exporter with double-glycine peptidase domain
MKRINLVEQMEKNECGLACLTMMFNYYGYNISLNELRNKFPAPQSGISFYHMDEICSHYHFKTEAFKISKENVSKLEKGSITLPVIIQWDKGTHFVVLEKITKSYVDVMDPSIGSLRVESEDFRRLFTGNLIYIEPKSAVPSVVPPKTNRFLLEAFKPNVKPLLIVFTISLFLQLFNTVPALMLGNMVDSLHAKYTIDHLSVLLTIIGIPLFSFLFLFMRGKVLISLQNRIDFSVMSKYFLHFLNLPISFFEKRQQGDLIYRANLLTNIRDVISNHFLGIFLNISLIIVFVFFMLRISLELGLLMIMYGCLIVLLLMFFTSITYNLSKKVLLKETELQEYMAETINSIYDIKSYAFQSKTYAAWEKIFSKYLTFMKQSNLYSVGIDSFLASLRIIQSIVIFFIGSYMVINGELTVGTLLSFLVIAESFMAPIFSSCSSYFSLVQISSVFQRIQDVFDSEVEQDTSLNKISPSKLVGKIEFRNVSFQFNRFEPLILDNISFIINPGETVWLQGESGSGKSTILKLILGIYKQTNGEILIDDVPIELYEINSLRSSIAAVLQESRLFNKSIVDNITSFNENTDPGNLYEAIVDSNLEQVINNLSAKEETMVSENGANFSGGQRQKILIARALYKGANLLLLDEATNSLDRKNEDFIMERISSKNLTKIIITHDDNTLKSYDKVLLLSNKTIKVKNNKSVEKEIEESLVLANA